MTHTPNQLFDIKGKVAIVTGASSGLGVQFTEYLAECGCKLAICARRVDRMEELAKKLTAKNVEVFVGKCDATKPDEVASFVQSVKAKYGRIDILVNNAGVLNMEKAESQSNEEWLRIIDCNVNGVYWFAREVGKIMIAQKSGKIINIGSIHSNTVISAKVHTLSSYVTSKGAVLMMTKALACEWAQYGIQVNAIGPAYFGSEMTEAALVQGSFQEFVANRCPTGRPGREGELNGALHYFASEASSYTTGQLLNVDGGWNTI
ncbi:putative Gluconate 5-dehydrogenase [Blattamonas nauphoetae]|uniref:Gluconate 5-dehydrogenase n=1 Tax=Blattamonas nauphoetae TaxID=2049346 RepID=A0ABQ9XDU1_9EUKA|nr:putative Gluconate 5-dehydrogenase [Blattamonas nauphoetae]KAK2950647.1 putative Gluconate 5-dehydrogenase [Blattamonas nauphoetae]